MAKSRIFFGTYSKGAGNGLFSGEFDGDSGAISLNGNTVDIENPSYLQLDPSNNNILYGVSEIGSFEGENGGALFSVDISDSKQMRLIDIKCTHGKHPCHLCVTNKFSGDDNFVFAANYSEGSLSIFESDNSGNIKPSCQSIHHFGKGTNPGRQKQSHIHFANLTPDRKYLAVCDLGTDKVFLYPYFVNPHQNLNGLITDAKTIDCPPGAGPRHFTFSKDRQYLYVLTELSNTVLAYKYNCGDNIELMQEISTLPSDFKDKSTAAAIHLSPDGTLLAASNRGHDSVAVYKIQDNGELVFISHIMTGKEPRDFRFSPDGKWLLSANQNDNSVTIFKIENNTFTKTGEIGVPQPVCILFGGEI